MWKMKNGKRVWIEHNKEFDSMIGDDEKKVIPQKRHDPAMEHAKRIQRNLAGKDKVTEYKT